MKKAYETPSVEMIAFRYRDQIVAASATDTSGQNGSSRSGDACDFLGDIGKFVDGALDGIVCDWNAFS